MRLPVSSVKAIAMYGIKGQSSSIQYPMTWGTSMSRYRGASVPLCVRS